MAKSKYSLPYLPHTKNIEKLFEKIKDAKVPDALTHRFLTNTFGLKSPNDRPLIPLLKALGFLDDSGKPTDEYRKLKNPNLFGATIAKAVQKAYAELFAAHEKANELERKALNGLIAQVTGADQQMTSKISATFSALANIADFSALKNEEAPQESKEDEEISQVVEERESFGGGPEFHYNIQIHLPPNCGEETYLNIFSALRRTLLK